MENKEHKELKRCPFLNEECMGGECALYRGMTRTVGGLQQQFGECSFNAIVILLSEINKKTEAKQGPTILLPGDIRGN